MKPVCFKLTPFEKVVDVNFCAPMLALLVNYKIALKNHPLKTSLLLIDKLNDITQNYCNKLACRITGAKIFWVAFPTYFKYHFYEKPATCVTLMLPTNDPTSRK